MAAPSASPSLNLPRRREGAAPERSNAVAAPAYQGLLEAVAVAANQAGGLEEALAFALARICECTAWTAGRIWVAGEAAGAGLELSRARHGHVNPLASGQLAARAWAGARAEWNMGREDGGEPAALAIPVSTGKDVVAVLEVFSPQPHVPEAALLRVLAQVARQLGLVAARQSQQKRLLHDSSHDPLTGLANRSLFLDRLRRALARNRRHAEARLAVLIVDLDRFHVLNDSLGNEVGDELLQVAGQRLEHTLRASETLARLSGDEFSVLLEDLQSEADALRVGERLLEALAAPVTLEGREIYLCASIGIACCCESEPGQLLRDADLAMGRAKALGGNRIEIYDHALHAAALTRMSLETDLRSALARQAQPAVAGSGAAGALGSRDFALHYQPIVDITTGAIQGVEALLRWQRNGSGLVYPGEFIPVAEDTGLILPLGLWVLRQACQTARAWQSEFPALRQLGIAVNLSPRQILQPDLAAAVGLILGETGIDPGTVRLEITESALAASPAHAGVRLEQALAVLNQLKALGLQLSIDDFGTGYSSLSYLHRIPLDIVKIDRSFVAQLGCERDSVPIVKTILDLARNLDLQIVAEGTETAAQVAQLRALGCPLAQGYYFARPMEAEKLRELLARAA